MIPSIILVLAVTYGAARAQSGCDTKADVTFLLDSSDNVGRENFNKELNFIKDVTNQFQIAQNKVQVSTVTFGTGPTNQFYLNQYTDKTRLQNAISSIQFRGGAPKMAGAIRYATGTSYSPIHGGRADAPHVVVLLTNQPSGTVDMTRLEAQTARDNGIILYTVGIGGGADLNELQQIASDPDYRHMFTAQNFDALGSISNLLAAKICNELPPNPNALPTPTACLQKADLVFMVDSSTSVGSTNFQKLEHFLKDVVGKLDVGPNKVQVGLVKYGNYPSVEFSLGQHNNRPEVLKAVEGMTYLGGGTNDADAITFTGQQVFDQHNGARGDVPRIAVMITDGGSSNPSAAIAAANKARTEHIGLITVGVGNGVNQAELNSIADKPSSDNSFSVNSYDNLDSITDRLIKALCRVKATEPSLTGNTLPTDPCQDKLTNCDQYDTRSCIDYPQWAQDNCAKTCGICTPLYTNAPPKCQDKTPNCGTTYRKSDCTLAGSPAQTNCPLFCGLCAPGTSSTGYYGQCSYKGKSYATGETWYDGCDYECVCQDGNTGRYKCNNRCPVYYDLPTDCTLVAQQGECCLQPVCNFNPTVNIQQSSGHGVTPSGIDVCVYKNKQYFQGQTWRDGCDFQCQCTDAKKGLFRCEDLCPTYGSIPPYCHLETKAGECCAKPMCEFSSQSGSFQGTGSISGAGVGAIPSAHPPCKDAITTCSSYGKSVCYNYRGWASSNCMKYCDMCPTGMPDPGPDDRCIYGGKLYQQGETWNTSCSTLCTCENSIYGYYRCVDSCPQYNNVPSGCTTVKKAGDCCPTLECGAGYFVSSQTNPNTIGNGAAISVINPPTGMNQVIPTLPTGEKPFPGTGGSGFSPSRLNGCLYKGQIYVQDQAWEDGCEYSCLCKNAISGLYTCRQKCPSYPALSPSCTLVPDENDLCCKAPKCTKDPVTQQIPVPIPLFRPAIQSHGSVEPPSLISSVTGNTYTVFLFGTGLTPEPPTAGPAVSGGVGYCMYNGQRYTHGQIWEDGCDFNCVCDDASKGHYTCTEKCAHYGAVPDHCYLVKDPSNPCCTIPKCNLPVNYVTEVGVLQVQTTPKPGEEFCVYEGKQYQQGQTWYDGCSYKCTCEDAVNNLYRCLTRCPEYENTPDNCKFVPDPRDPSCCVMPECPSSTTPSNSLIPTPAPSGVYVGPGQGTGFCEYKGVQYTQGQSWQDGCDLNCVCTDSTTGLYKCSEVCENYVNLPSYCTLITDFTNPCCKKPKCNFQGVTTAVTGAGTTKPTLAPTPPPPGQTPVPGSTPAPTYKFCVYKGVNYYGGQTWEDGCQYKCRCDDADKGLYTCNERCAQYDNIPQGCIMVTDPRDSCCLVPSCTPQPQSTPAPGVSTPVPTPYQVPTAPPGSVTGSANVPTPKPGMTPPPINYCVYKGQQYSQGQKWDDGCQFTCECVDASTGKYKCLEKCRQYVNLPSNCRLSKDPSNPCCQVPECTGQPTPAPPTVYTQPPGPVTQPPNVCVYKGQYYTQGQTWYDGCDYVCNCENAMEGTYRCNERCPKYDPLPKECRFVPSTSDPLCCQEPKCTFVNTNNQTSGYLTPPTPPPGVIDGGKATPSPAPSLAPSPGSPVSTPSPQPCVCIYKGNQYQQGQKWKDGCEYNCECVDSCSGHYRCTEMCNKYDDLPAGCRMVNDPYNPCCKKAYCPAPVVPTPAPPGVSTQAPTIQPKSGCMYYGVMFGQGEQWNDGCDLICVCEDETTGFYRCRDRCNKYDIAEGCTLVTDPRDSCCKVPSCVQVPKTTPPPITPAIGYTFPPGKIPTPAPGYTYAPGKYPTWVPGMVPTPAPGLTYPPNLIPTPAPGRTYAPWNFPTYVPGLMVPTPAPGYTYAPGKVPTPGPGQTYAPGKYPTWVPGMVPTPAPGYTYSPYRIPTPAPGRTYAPGQFPTWVPGMVPTPAPGYTYAPNEIPTPAPGRTYAPGKYPTWVPGMVPTPAPGYTYPPYLVPTPAPGQTYAPGKFPVPTNPTPAPGRTFAPYRPGQVPTPAPGQTYAPNLIPTPAPGQTYAPGKFPTYVPGMIPTPAPGVTIPPWLVPAITPAPGSTYAPFSYPTWVPGFVPTPAPGMTYAPDKIPTPAPGRTYAPWNFPTYVPGMVPTPAPGQTFAPNLIPTPAPGQTYAPGKFPTYIPGLMVPTPAPGATYAPGKIPTPGPGQTYAPGMYPTWVPGMVPTPAPGQTYAPNRIPTPAPGQTYAPGKYPTYVPGMVPTPAPGQTFAPNLIPTPAPGQTYAPGKFPTYIPGLMVPTPAPGYTYAPGKVPTPSPGQTYAPGQYPTWVPGMVPTPAPGYTYAPNRLPTPAPGQTYAPGKYPTYVPGMVPTPAPGQTYAPNLIPTPAPGQTYAPGKFPTYVPGLMVPTPQPGYTYAPGKVPTPAPGQTYAPGKYPTWVPGMIPTPAPGYTYPPYLVPTPGPGQTYAPGKFPVPTNPTPAPGQTYAPYVPGQVPTPAPGQTYAPNLIPTPAPGQTYAPGKFPTYFPGMVPTPAPGRTIPPWLVPGITPAPGSTYAPFSYPTWVPGFVPTPAPGQTYAPNLIPTPAPGRTYAPYNFPTYVPGLMVPTPAPGSTFAPNMIPTPAPGQTYAPGKYPTYIPGLMVPTPAPGSTYAPNKIPTPAPGQTYAPGKYPTWVPGMVPTPAPGQTYAPNRIPTPAPGQTYAPGKYPTYVPGMVPTPYPGQTFAPNLIPTPAPGQTYAPGKYPTYIPGLMIPTPAPGLTYPPYFIPTPAPGQTYAPGKYPTWVPGMVPTPAPGQTYAPNNIPTPAPYRTYAPGRYPTWVPGMVPTPAPGQTFAPNMVPTPAPGQTYAPGKYPTYIPGLMVPTPAPGYTYAPNRLPTPAPGQTYAPGKYPTYVPGMVPTPAPGQTYAPNLIPTPAPGQTYAPGKFPTYVPGLMVPTPQPGYTYAPGKVPTPAPGQTYAPGKYPTWVPGMIPTPALGYTYPPYLVPTPGPGQTYAPGKFPVPTNPTPAPGQTYAPYVPGQVPTPAPGQTYAPNLIPTPAPGQTYAPGKFPTYFPGMVPTPAPGRTIPPWLVPGITPAPGSTYAPFSYPTWVPGFVPTPAPGQTYAPNLIPTPAPGRTYAPYNFPTYVPGLMPPTPAPGSTFAPNLVPTPAPGQTFAPGKYPTYVPGLMVPTPAPGLTFAPNMIPTPAPGQTYAPGKYPTYIPGLMVPTPAPGYTYAPNRVPTPAPGRTYAPGKYPTWVPGMIPTPAPGQTFAPNMIPTPSFGQTYAPGKYPTWVPGMVPTPAPGYTYAPGEIPTPAPGSTYAPGFFPVPTPNLTPKPNPYPVPTAVPGTFQGSGVNNNVSGCVHYGVVYRAGQTWQDGCKYDCECLDDHTGRYQCKERCPLFLNIPSYCRMITDPNDACCRIPVCNTPAPTPNPTPNPYPNPTVGPNPNPTAQPNPSPTPGPNPNPQPTPAPQPKTPGCVMNGQRYLAGQTWYMGCDQQCVCEDGQTGFYRCFDRCASYPTVPTGCTLVADPKDPVCCQVPQCIPEPVPGQTQPTGPPQTYTGVPGVVTGSGTPSPITPKPGSGLTSAPRNVCVYNGKTYTQGERWQDGCKYNCICTDGMTGKYECTERCASFPFVPPQCTMRRDPNDICCYLPVCDNNQTVPSLAPFPQSTLSPPPAGISTASPPLTLPPSYCVYNGVAFRQGQTWDDGCSKKCRCDDADMNIYTCFDRCKVYNNIGSGCVMVADPMDSCCQIPRCTYIPTPAPPVTKGPGVSTLSPPTAATPCPYPMPTAVPGTISGGPQPDPVTGAQPTNLGYCEYKGQRYSQGQSWDDGCSYTCLCLDANSGQYQCQEKCPRYVGLPSYCKMAQDPNNKCCSKPACDVCPHTPVPGVVSTPGPSAVPTPAPQPKEVCIMNGKQYTQGQQWYDGCKQICVCTDGKTGHYSCHERCASYQRQAGCTFVPDPNDPVCCEIPKCNNQQGVYGTINGTGTPPTLQPGTQSPITGSRPPPTPKPQVCVYQGKYYTQGQKWQDGCQYECECLDATTGYFKCTDRCPRYPNLAANCKMVRDPTNPCCMKPECPATPTPGTGPTPAPTPAEFCVYQGVPLRQGQTVNQGCDKICRCEDATTGKIVCNDRCKTYPALPSNCTLVTDPADQCCQVPKCTNPNTNNPNQVITGVPGTITGSNLPNNNPFQPTGSRNGCVYKGQLYTQGQTWKDGCQYNCECLDSSTGFYRCQEICPQIPALPSYCSLVQDPNNNCCQKPYCTPLSQTTPNPSPNPVSGAPTPAPTPVCVYKNNNYQQGQQWYDGCDFICRCDDASKNVYQCQQRCPVYNNVQSGCTMVPDPKDPTCCEIPSCPITPPTGPNPTPGIVATPVPGGVVTGARPTPAPGATLPPPYRSGCVYKGQLFYQGQKFDDGCDYECECLSNATGKYKCVEKCPTYGTIPVECRLIQDPNKPCCQVPYCDFVNPTPFTGGIPTSKPKIPTPRPGVITVAPYVIPQASTPVPWINPTPAPSNQPSPTPVPQGYCVYKGVYYTQGQVWNDGCERKCRCEDVSTGYYTCNQRCPSYPASSCPRKTDPTDSCCLIPDCNNIPTPIPSPGPGQSTLSPTVTPQPVTGSFTGVVPYQPGQGFVGTMSACIYKGYTYTQGQKWQDGCSYNCECIDASRGQYRCSDRCGRYPSLPANCHFKQSPTDSCCKVAECDTYGTVAPVTSDKCLDANGVEHVQGSSWVEGCSVTCTCTDARANTYTCTDRCPVYSGLPTVCTLIRDPDDICCMKPQCQLQSGSTLIPYIGNGPSGSGTPPTSLQVVPVGTHEVFSGYGKPQPGTVYDKRHVCVYKGSVYNDSQSWDDGCKYVCTCIDGSTGLYKCTSKCPQYPTLPSYCKSVNVPGQCCPSISCDIPGYGTYNPVPQLVPTPMPKTTPAPGMSTANPYYIQPVTGIGGGYGNYPGGGYYLPNATNPQVIGSLRDKCVYKNQLYNQGESWTDGCQYRCECQDARTGYYVCQSLCPVYNNLPSNQCYLQKANGECCAQPLCYDPSTGSMVNPMTSSSVFPVVGTFSGGFSGFRPVTPGSTFGSRDACVYKGTIYHKGDKWEDQCDFSCVCEDEKTGMYKCSQKCPSFTRIPPLCRLESQPNTCCKRVVCSSSPSSQTIPPQLTSQIPSTQAPIRDPNCYDNLDNCADYHLDQNQCSTTYKQWAERNCNLTCGFCKPKYTPAPQVCEDKLQDCKDYGLQACSGVYEPWAKDNCRKFCGLCTSSSPQPVTTGGNTCKDNLDNCAQLGQLFCSGQYLDFAKQNCQKYCNLCPGSPGAVTTPIPSTTTQSLPWILMLKGVAGAPGPDLFQLWNGPNTLNQNTPLANHLTTEFNGHYKPDYSNYWGDYCIDKVKVSIYKNGVEKANIVFNATGTDKNGWFTADRIIDSTYSDIQTAQKELVSLKGDSQTGREFYLSGHIDQNDRCDSFGWMFISTQTNVCFLEQGEAKPQFYYAPGQTQFHYAVNNPVKGDVFAIQAHPNCMPSVQHTSKPTATVAPVCDYKNKQYKQGESWSDGCQYNCTCEDASLGYYRCRNLCPQYTNLPPGCTLVTTPGQCCAAPQCQGTTSKPPVIYTFGPNNFCYFNGKGYAQGQTWNDGCRQSCTCTDASMGFYSCRAICLNWSQLPSTCHMEPAPPGLCCQQPKCPPQIILQIPSAYKDQYPGYTYV